MTQATQVWNGITVYRWRVHTTRGSRTTWKVSAKKAKDAAEAIGLTVLKVEPAGSAAAMEELAKTNDISLAHDLRTAAAKSRAAMGE